MSVIGSDSVLSTSDQQKIESLRNEAKAGIISWADANKEANNIRSNYGYSGGSTGDKVTVTDKTTYDNATKASSSGGSSSGGSSKESSSGSNGTSTGGTTTGGTVATTTSPTGWDEKLWGTYKAGTNDFSTVRDNYAKNGNITMAAEVDRLRDAYVTSKGGTTSAGTTTGGTSASGTTSGNQGTTYTWSKNLYQGIYNSSDVKQLQQALNSLGYKIAVDGNYGTETANAVKQYQKANGLTVDGKTGPETRTSIQNALNKQTTVTVDTTTPTTPTQQPTQQQQTQQQTETPLTEMSNQEIVEQLYDTIINNFTDTTEIQDFLTWAESYAYAKEMYTPQYETAFKNADNAIVNNALSGGWMGQPVTEAARYEARTNLEGEMNQYVNELAYDIMNNSKEDAIQIMQAKMEAEEFDLDKLIAILGLAESYLAKDEEDNTDDEVAQQIVTTDDSTQKKDTTSKEDSSESVATYNTVLSGLKNKSLSNDTAQKDVNSIYPTLSASQQRELVKTLNAGNYNVTINTVAYGATSASVSQVVALQKALKASGAYTGDIDGSYGPATKKAAGNLSAEDAYKKYVSQTTIRKQSLIPSVVGDSIVNEKYALNDESMSDVMKAQELANAYAEATTFAEKNAILAQLAELGYTISE